MIKLILISISLFSLVFSSCNVNRKEETTSNEESTTNENSFSPIDSISNKNKVKIQEWMSQNLDVDKFRNGDKIPEVKTNEDWIKAGEEKKPAWCYYNNDLSYGRKYGKLYNWYAVTDARGLAPVGWHIPNKDEWAGLIENRIEYQTVKNDLDKIVELRLVAGKKIKSKTGWMENGNGTNEFDFYGLPGGQRWVDGSFKDVGYEGCWWSSSVLDNELAWCISVLHDFDGINTYPWGKFVGFSVRCVKD